MHTLEKLGWKRYRESGSEKDCELSRKRLKKKGAYGIPGKKIQTKVTRGYTRYGMTKSRIIWFRKRPTRKKRAKKALSNIYKKPN